MDLTRPAIELHIERLVLTGFGAADGAPLGAALQQELGRLLAAGGVDALLGARHQVERVDAGTVPFSPATPQALGRRVAGAVHTELSR
jgi:hypothetical protein